MADTGSRVCTDGKFFSLGSERFSFRGVTYGTFRPRGDGALFPERERVKQDFISMRDAGFTVVRTYTEPPDDLLDLASDWGLRLFPGAFYLDWRYLVGASRRQCRGVLREARETVRAAARRLAGDERVVALCLGNEVPADVVRWFGSDRIAGALADLAEVVREEDPGQLVTYANYPTTEYLDLHSLDFLTFNVFLERRVDFRRYLTRLHHLAGDRPLVLGEIGLDSSDAETGEERQAGFVDWQLETALERGVAGSCLFSWTDEWAVGGKDVSEWRFGLTRADRSAKPSLEVAAEWNTKSISDLTDEWPLLSVVICAYNAEETLDECLEHTCALDYPALEVLVVDDGSTDSTADICRRHERAKLLSIDHAGLGVARNAGFREASGEIVAYLDSDAYPSREWPYYLVLGFDDPNVAGSGGPNIPPRDAQLGAQQVAQAPGGPVHVLLSDSRAEHVPGCNMAFYRYALDEVGGCDPVYTSAGDDVDLCWKVLDRGYDIGFHPAALVWHHRRAGLRTYLRQQRGYGRAEALVEARHPDRFTSLGSARWRGRIYDSISHVRGRQRIYRGLYGAAAYQSVYGGGGHAWDIVHQLGVPLATVLLLSLPLGLIAAPLAAPAVAAALALITIFVVDTARAWSPRTVRGPAALRFRTGVALLHVLQPVVRAWGRLRHAPIARRQLPAASGVPGPARRVGGLLVLPSGMARADVAAALVGLLRRSGLRVVTPTGWEDHDARILASVTIQGDVVTSAHPNDAIQLRVRRRLRPVRTVAAIAVIAVSYLVGPTAGYLASVVVLGDLLRGWWRSGPLPRRLVVAEVGSATS